MSDIKEIISTNNITLDKLKQIFSEDSDKSDRDIFLTELLNLVSEPSDLNIIELLNSLCKQYNSFYSDTATYEKAKEYHGCLYELFDWIVPFLNTYHKLVLYTNLCILSDDDRDPGFHNDHFGICLNKATDFVEKYGNDRISNNIKDEDNDLKRTFCKALYYLGFLNLKEHRYEKANRCFKPCVEILLDGFIDPTTDNFSEKLAKDQYFNCAVRMANCYEYQDETWKALHYMLGLSESDQDNWIKHISDNADQINRAVFEYYKMLSKSESVAQDKNPKDNTIQTVKEICRLLLYPDTVKRPLEVFELDESGRPLDATVKQYIHVLAHCISEYAAKLRMGEITDLQNDIFPACSTLQLVSRFLLDWLVTSCGEVSLVSCQATIRAENDACPEAISLLIQRYHTLEQKKKLLDLEFSKCLEKLKEGSLTADELKRYTEIAFERETSERELTEISFYLFYFSEQELRDNYKDEKLECIFNQYGELFKQSAEKTSKDGDFDPLFHYYVIKVKYLLKRKAESLLRANESTDYSELDFEFANMCTYKEKCSDHIFEGLIQEYQRLVRLYSVFQKFRWLTADTSKASILRELNHLLSSDNSGDDIDNCIEINGDIDYDQLVYKVYEGIRLRKKILILAPVKDAPSCSSEYEEIKQLIEFCSIGLRNNIIDNPAAYSFDSIADNQDYCEIQLKVLNNRQDLTRLKFAVQIDTPGSTNNKIVPGNNIYLYVKHNEDVNTEYREVFPLVMEGDEVAQLTNSLNQIKNQLRAKVYRRARDKNGGVCPRSNNHDSSYGTKCCTYHISYEEITSGLEKSIRDLLVFLEYDFHASLEFPISKNDILLVSHPIKQPHHFFAILVFDSAIPEVEGGKGLCSLCESFCVEQIQKEESAVDVTDKTREEKKSKSFCKKYSTNPKQQIDNCLSKLENIKDNESESGKAAQAIYDKIHKTCGNNVCKISNVDECYVAKAITEWNLKF